MEEKVTLAYAMSGLLVGYKATEYPSPGPDITMAGVTSVLADVSEVVVGQNLLILHSWTGVTAIFLEFSKLMGAKIKI